MRGLPRKEDKGAKSLAFGAYDPVGKKFLLDTKVPVDSISRDSFKPVRIGVVPVLSERTFVWMSNWAVSCSMGRCYVAGHDDRFEIWLSLKLDEKGGLLCDRGIFVKVDPGAN